MANYTPSDLLAAQAKLFGSFAAQEMRFRTPVTHLEFLRQSEIMIPSYMELRKREDRVVSAYYKLRSSRTLGSARTHNHTGTHGDSGVFTPTWLTNEDKFAISLKQGDQNIFNHDEMLANEFEQIMINMVEGMDADAESYAFSNRSTENVATQQGTFDAVDDTFDIASADLDRAVQITKTVMDTNKFSGNITLFCDSIAFDTFESQRFQGAGNSTNLAFNFNNNVKMVHSLGMDAFAAGLAVPRTKGFWIAVVDGTIASLPWIPKQNREGKVTTVNTYSSMINPIDSLSYAVHSYETRADDTATNGYTQDVTTQVQVSVDIALDNAPIVVTGATSTLLAFAIV